jgi:hypothetical protein
MTETITLPNKLANRISEDLEPGKSYIITERGTDVEDGFFNTDSFVYFTFVESHTVDTNHGDYENILVIRRDSDEKLFGAEYREAVNADLYHDQDFPGEPDSRVEFKELIVKERVVVTRDYTFAS